MTPEPLTLVRSVVRNAAEHAAKAVVVTEDRSLSHGMLDTESRGLAARLVAAGVGKGARVGLLAPNGIEWVVAAVAVARIGAVLVPLSTLLRPPELAAQLRVADVAHLVVTRSFRGRAYLDDLDEVAPGLLDRLAAGALDPSLPCLRSVWALDDLPSPSASPAVVVALEEAVSPGDDLAVLFTSGSRGTPKGTVHTHDGALHAVAASLGARRLGPDDRLYIPMPFFWTGGFSMGLLSVIVAGATLLTEAVPEADRTLELLRRERVTLFRGWPDQAAALAAHPRFAEVDLGALRPGSLPAVLPPGQRPAPGRRPVLFGMTETFGTYVGGRLDLDLPEDKRGSNGQVLDGVELRVVDPGSDRPVEPGAVGELCVRGRNVMRAICGRTRAETFDDDGFYRTGDLGRLDDDGYVWFEGRADDMFKVKGATVYPTEVETALRAVDGVRQAHVTDVVVGEGGPVEVGAVVLTGRPLHEVAAEVALRLSAFKVPTRWLALTEGGRVPMTATAKVDKAMLQDLLRREGAPVRPDR